jgi:hypothetical protein
MELTDDEWMQRFGLELLRRVPEAQHIGVAEVTMGEWRPREHECHDNVAFWVEPNPGYRHVGGFLYFDWHGLLPTVRFNAHSLVEAPDGKLYEITPSRASARYPFLRHTGSLEDFQRVECQSHLDVSLR